MSGILDPKLILAIKDLALAAKTAVDGFMAGIHKSNVKGTGMEFSQYRSYQPGDDLRSLDWKMFARSDRYYIRESETETSVSVRLVIDASNSMRHEDNGYSKIDYARYLAAALAYLAGKQGDSVGLYVFNDGKLFSLPARKDHQHLSRLFYQMETIQAAGHFTGPLGYKDIFSGSHQRELLIVLTDFYEMEEEITGLLGVLASLRHELMLFHLIGRNETDLSFSGYHAVQDLETGTIVPIGQSSDMKQYRERFNSFLESKKNFCHDKNIFYRLTMLDEPMDRALRDFLNQRNKLKLQ